MVTINTPGGQGAVGTVGPARPTAQRITARPLLAPTASGGEAAGKRLQELGALGTDFANKAYALEVDNKLLEVEQATHEFEMDLFDPENGLLTRKGAGARGISAEARDRTEKFRKELLERSELYGTARQAAEQYLQGRANGYEKKAVEYEAAQARAYRSQLIAARESAIEDKMALAVLNGDMGQIDSIIASAVGASDTASADAGLPGEARNNRARKTVTKLHAIAIDALLARGDATGAWTYYNERADEMDPSDRIKIERQLRPVAEEEALKIEATARTDALENSGLSAIEMYDAVRNDDSLREDLKDAITGELNTRIRDREAFETLTEEANYEEAFELAQEGRLADVPPSIMATMDPASKANLQVVNAGYSLADNTAITAPLLKMSYDELQAVNLARLQGEMTPETFNLLKEMKSNPEAAQSLSAFNQVLDDVAAEAGLRGENQTRALRIQGRAYLQAEADAGRTVTPTQMEEELARIATSSSIPAPRVPVDPSQTFPVIANNEMDTFEALLGNDDSTVQLRATVRSRVLTYMEGLERAGIMPSRSMVRDRIAYLLEETDVSIDTSRMPFSQRDLTRVELIEMQGVQRERNADMLGVDLETYDTLAEQYLAAVDPDVLGTDGIDNSALIAELQGLIEIMNEERGGQ